jgi:hypothetical protein
MRHLNIAQVHIPRIDVESIAYAVLLGAAVIYLVLVAS